MLDKNVGHQYIWFDQDQTINNIWCPYGPEYFSNLQYHAEQYFFIGGLNIDIPEHNFVFLSKFPSLVLFSMNWS